MLRSYLKVNLASFNYLNDLNFLLILLSLNKLIRDIIIIK